MSTLTIHIAEPVSLSLFRFMPAAETVWLSVAPARERAHHDSHLTGRAADSVPREIDLAEYDAERWDGLS